MSTEYSLVPDSQQNDSMIDSIAIALSLIQPGEAEFEIQPESAKQPDISEWDDEDFKDVEVKDNDPENNINENNQQASSKDDSKVPSKKKKMLKAISSKVVKKIKKIVSKPPPGQTGMIYAHPAAIDPVDEIDPTGMSDGPLATLRRWEMQNAKLPVEVADDGEEEYVQYAV